jgi:hypothetical protein
LEQKTQIGHATINQEAARSSHLIVFIAKRSEKLNVSELMAESALGVDFAWKKRK